jgi:hypothetical protein
MTALVGSAACRNVTRRLVRHWLASSGESRLRRDRLPGDHQHNPTTIPRVVVMSGVLSDQQ